MFLFYTLSTLSTLSTTIFQKTKVLLQKRFLAIALILNAKKSLSSCELARDLDMNQKSVWYMQQRIRAEMAVGFLYKKTQNAGLGRR